MAQRCMERASMPLERVQLGPFVLDLSRYELTHTGSPVRLERIPMDLLILLVREGGDWSAATRLSSGSGAKTSTLTPITASIPRYERFAVPSAKIPRNPNLSKPCRDAVTASRCQSSRPPAMEMEMESCYTTSTETLLPSGRDFWPKV